MFDCKLSSRLLALSFGLTFRYIVDDLLLNISHLSDFVDRIYPIQLDIKYTTETERYASYLDYT